MKIFQQYFIAAAALFVLASTYSCQQSGGESTGSEFIPDMTHSVAYEANVYSDYDMNSWETESVKSRRELVQPRKPVNGTVPRGYSAVGVSDGVFASAGEAAAYTASRMKDNGGITFTPNGAVPYYYPDTEDGRSLAMQQVLYNPFPISQNGIARGQELYNIYCGICHGDKGDGGGYLVEGPSAKFAAQPANFLLDEFVNATNGRYYHSIIYGKNTMGGYGDKLSFEERWQVIHYIRTLQAKEKKLKYSFEANTLNPAFGVPESLMPEVAVTAVAPTEEVHEEEHHDDDHGHDHGH